MTDIDDEIEDLREQLHEAVLHLIALLAEIDEPSLAAEDPQPQKAARNFVSEYIGKLAS
jgi:hypothetical protein